MRIAVVGAGIAGLACGCACALRGFEVTVFEQAPELTEIGAGLQVSANGYKVLDALGVIRNLSKLMYEPTSIDLRLGRSGKKIWSLPMKKVSGERWGAPYVHVHRADLVDELARRFEQLASDAVRKNFKLVGYRFDNHKITLMSDNCEEGGFDLLIGADGIRSQVRNQMLGPSNPSYAGNVAWRAVLPAQDVQDACPPENTTIWAGRGKHVVTTRLRDGGLINFVGVVERPEPSAEGWQITGSRDEALRDFAEFAPPIRAILTRAETLNRWALFSRSPLARWSDGPVALVGDAAHPMLPSMAQGAVQAIEDAWVFAAILEEIGDPAETAKRFYQERFKHTARIQAASAANARMFHRAGPIVTPVYYGGMLFATRLFPELLLRKQEWVYSHDVVSEWP